MEEIGRYDRWWERGKTTGNEPIRYATVYSAPCLCSLQCVFNVQHRESAVRYTNHRCTVVLSWLSLVTWLYTSCSQITSYEKWPSLHSGLYVAEDITYTITIWQSPEVTGFAKIACASLSRWTSKGHKLFQYVYNVLWWGRIDYFFIQVVVGTGQEVKGMVFHFYTSHITR